MLISRVAESCFWLNRYVERVDSLSRLLDVNLAFQLDVNLPAAERWRPLLVVTGVEEDFAATVGATEAEDGERVQEYLVWERENPSSLYCSIAGARENARTIRETVSLEMWESLNGLWLWLNGRSARDAYRRDPHAFYVRIRDAVMLYHGLSQNTMLHEEPFEFMRLGTALERADQTARILDVKYHSLGPMRGGIELPAESAQWLATLRSCSAIEPFFKASENVLSGAAVAEFLLFEPGFPRSVLHNLLRARNFLNLIRPPERPDIGERSARLVEDLINALEELRIEAVLDQGIHGLLTRIVGDIAQACDAVHKEFFDPPLRVEPPAWLAQRQGQTQVQTQGEPAMRELRVFHRTAYHYDSPVEASQHVLRLCPVEDQGQEVLSFELRIAPRMELREFEDVFGNRSAAGSIVTPYDVLEIEARARVRVRAVPVVPRVDPVYGRLPLRWMPWQEQMMLPYLLPPELPESELRVLSSFAHETAERNDRDLMATLLDLNTAIHREIEYRPGSTTVATTPFETFRQRRGVCQDFANLMICLARLLNVPARYRVGYVFTGSADGMAFGSDASHAWVELYLPQGGWLGFDPTNGTLAGPDHVRVACGRNYRDAAPTSGTLLGGGEGETLSVSVHVEQG